MRTICQQQEGGFIENPKNRDFRGRRFRPGRRETRDALKTGADFAAEQRAARQRWAGMPPIVAAREMIAEADIMPELLGRVSAAISGMPEGELAEFVNSGELSRQLAELAAG